MASEWAGNEGDRHMERVAQPGSGDGDRAEMAMCRGTGAGDGGDGQDSPGSTGALMNAGDRGRASEGLGLEPHPLEHPPFPAKDRVGMRRQNDKVPL